MRPLRRAGRIVRAGPLCYNVLAFLADAAEMAFILPKAGDSVLLIFFTVLLVVFSLGLIATVLLQSGRSAGLSGAISGGAESFFGKKKGLDEFLSRLTTVFAIGFLVSALAIAFLER